MKLIDYLLEFPENCNPEEKPEGGTVEKSESSKEELNENEVSGTDEKSKSSKEELNDNDSTDSSDPSSPRGVLENAVSSTDSDSGSTGDPLCLERSSSSHWRSLIGGLLLRRKKSMRRFSTFPPVSATIGTGDDQQTESGLSQEEILKGRPLWRSFDYQELAAATDSFSPGSKEGLEWKVRFKIALGIAQGLLYLHEGCHRRIIHRDIKASNILLMDDFQPQISDFGLAKWLPDKWTHHIVFPIEGTFGYLAPEYFMHGVVSEMTDVFAYGVLLLELITGRRAIDATRKSLVIWAKPLLDANNLKELIDPSLGDAYDPKELERAVSAASMCIHHLSTARPTMNWVVRLLRGEEGSVELMGRAPKLNVGRPPMFDAGDLEDYTCSRYLDDLNRHKQLALEQ